MSLLKSAWEIALEKTEDIEVNPEKVRHDSLITDGKRLAGTYLTELEADGHEIAEALASAPEEDRELLRQGIATTVVSNVALPQSTEYTDRVNRLKHIAQMLDGPSSESEQLLDQIAQFMGKYLDARDSLLERAKQQYQPMFEQKQEQMMQKYGRAANMSVEQDPEFIQFLQKHYNQLSKQYQQVLDQAKDQLKQIWHIQ